MPAVSLDFPDGDPERESRDAGAALLALELRELRHLMRSQAGGGARPRRSNPDKRLLTLAEFARAAGVDRKGLPKLIASGAVKTVPWLGRTSGSVPGHDRVRIPASELERIERDGLRPPEQPKPRPVPKRTKAAPKSAALPSRIRDLDY